jgi:hypothetical protein
MIETTDKVRQGRRRGPKRKAKKDRTPAGKPLVVPPEIHAVAKQMAHDDDRTIGAEMSLLIRAEVERRKSPGTNAT